MDHLAYQLVSVGTGSPGPFKWVYFPIFECAQKFEAEKNAQIHGMRPEAIKVIEAVKPYKGGNDTLWRLHELNRIDKHRLLITVGSAYRSLDLGAVMRQLFSKTFPDKPVPTLSAFFRPADRLFPLKTGDALFADAPDAEVNEKLQFRFEVALREVGIIEGEPLIETLQQMTDLISNLIPDFAPFLV